MEKGPHKILSAALILALFSSNGAATPSEDEYISRIKSAAAKGRTSEMQTIAGEYFKRYPRGNRVADARLILAENEQNPNTAVKYYKTLVDNYRYFTERDYAQYKLCQLLFLLSRWEALRDESIRGIKLFRNSRYISRFKLYLAQANLHLGSYEISRDICAEIIRQNMKDQTHSEALLLMSIINKKMYGFSRGYLTFLYEFLTGFKNSEKMPSAIFMLGNYYEAKRDYSRAFSAYSDIVNNYPRSMESIYAAQGIERISEFRPEKVKYMPDRNTIDKTDDIDIQPETEITEDSIEGKDIIYSISIGPFPTLDQAEKIRKLLVKDFHPIKIVEIKRQNFMIYAGKYPDLDSAVSIKTRMAVEFGINGIIVRMIRDSKKLYIYEE